MPTDSDRSQSIRPTQRDYWRRPSLLQFLTALEDGTYTVEDALHLGLLTVCRQYNERLKRFLASASRVKLAAPLV